jgi:hypothetical protein
LEVFVRKDIGTLILSFAIALLVFQHISPRKEFYVIAVKSVPSALGGERILLDYTVDGLYCAVDFPDNDHLAYFLDHLGTVGKVKGLKNRETL